MAQGRPQQWLELLHIDNGEQIQFSKLLSHWRLVIGFTSRYLASHPCEKMCQPWRCAAQIPFQEKLLPRWYLEGGFQTLQIGISSRAPAEATFSPIWHQPGLRMAGTLESCLSGRQVWKAASTVWLPTYVGKCVNPGDTCLPYLFDSRLLWWEIIALGLPVCPAETFLDLSGSLGSSFLTSFFSPAYSEGNSHPHLLLREHLPNKSLAHLIPTWCPLLGLPWWLRW